MLKWWFGVVLWDSIEVGLSNSQIRETSCSRRFSVFWFEKINVKLCCEEWSFSGTVQPIQQISNQRYFLNVADRQKCWSKPQSWLMIRWYIQLYIYTYILVLIHIIINICTKFALYLFWCRCFSKGPYIPTLLRGHRLLDCNTGQSSTEDGAPHQKMVEFFVREFFPENTLNS